MEVGYTTDFFISYAQADQAWAEWIGWQLEKEGYTCLLRTWDLRPGGNFALEIHKAVIRSQRTIVVLSPDYLTTFYEQPEWAAAIVQDFTSEKGMLLPVRVRECKPQGILAPIVYIDLINLDEAAACSILLAGVRGTRAKPSVPQPFPGEKLSSSLSSSFPGSWPEEWKIPHRNPLFTGRDRILQQLHEQFRKRESKTEIYIQVISGLGGIGKTQIALEYAYRYCSEYRFVLWATATTEESLTADYLRLAESLQVSRRGEPSQQIAVNAFKRWLEWRQDWLLILDDVNKLELVLDFLPSNPNAQGHVILTTLTSAPGSVASETIGIEGMDVEEGKLFLLRRAKRLCSNAHFEQIRREEKEDAEAIVKKLGGLPLALDQAGAYIEETGCSLSDYLELYRTHRKELMGRRGELAINHPEAVDATWLLSLQKAGQEDLYAVALLQLCAFLAPDSIQEEMITKGAEYLGEELRLAVSDRIKFNDTLKALRKYSLVKRNVKEKTIVIHKLLQEMIKNDIDMENQYIRSKRVVQIVNNVFPFGKYENWQQCQHYLVQVQVCIKLIQQYQIEALEAATLLYNTGYYFYQKRVLPQAEECFLQAFRIRERLLGSDHPDVAITVCELVRLYRIQRKYDRAEALILRMLSIQEKAFGFDHINTAPTLHELACIYHDQGKYKSAYDLYHNVLGLRKKILGSEHPDTAMTLCALGSLAFDQGNYESAEEFTMQAFSIQNKIVGYDHPETASTLFSFAVMYRKQGQYGRAESLCQQALQIREKVLGLYHPDTVTTRESYIQLLRQNKRNIEAEALLARIKSQSDTSSS